MKRRLFFLALSVLVLILLLALLTIFTINSNNKVVYMITLLALLALTIYSLRIFIKEYLSYKLDIKQGPLEKVMVFYQLNVKINSDPKYAQATEPTATFKISDCDEFIDLYGDFSKTKLQKGNNYKISFYKHSRRIISIREAYKSEK